jgi:nucleotide-binding universal stress UspA family protein
MFQLQRILFPVDFSDRCRGAASYVEALVGRFDAELILVHVFEPPSYNTSLAERPDSLKLDAFDEFFGTGLEQLRVTRLIEHGEPARKIVECAAERHVDLIMMPTDGLGIYRRLIIGSNTAKVLHDAECPVWTGIHLEKAPPLEAIACRRITCAVDLKPASGRVLEWAHHLASEYQAELTVVHVAQAIAARPGRRSDREPEAQRKARRALGDLTEATGAHATVRVEGGDPAKVVTRLTGELRADLLVVGRRAEPSIRGRLGRTVYSIVRDSSCPVVSV